MEDRGPLKDSIDMDMGEFFSIRNKHRAGLSIQQISKIHWYSEEIIVQCIEDLLH